MKNQSNNPLRVSSNSFFARLPGLAVVSGVVCIAASAAGAIIAPASLNPGDKYHLVFVTSTTRDATSTDIADYNTHVQNAADAAGIGNTVGVTWYAIGSTQTVAARDNAVVGATTPVYLLNGTTKVADNFADMWNGNIDARINLTEYLVTYGSAVFTGSSDAGEIPDWGDQWLGDLAGEGPVVGSANAVNSTWMDNGAANGDPYTSRPFYALSEELTVVPEPSAAFFGGLGMLLMLLRRRRA
jgi:hypothetical protein